MDAKEKRKGGLSGIVAGRIRSAETLSREIMAAATEDVVAQHRQTELRAPELHMEPVSQFLTESGDSYTPSAVKRHDLENPTSLGGTVVQYPNSSTMSRRLDVTMEEALELVALPTLRLESDDRVGSHSDEEMKGTGAEPAEGTPRIQRLALTRARSAPKVKKQDVKDILKRTLSLRLHRHSSPLKLLGGVDIDSKSHLSTLPSTDCGGTKIESIECKAMDSRIRSGSLMRMRAKSPSKSLRNSQVAETSDSHNRYKHPIEATRDAGAAPELEIMSVLTFIEVDVEETDWEETGVSAMTAGSSSCFGDTASSRRAVEGVPRSAGFKGNNLDASRVLSLMGDANPHSDLVAFLEASAVPNDTGTTPVRPTEILPFLDPSTTSDVAGEREESVEYTYEDAVVIRDESHNENCIHCQISLESEESNVLDDRKPPLLGVEVSIDGTCFPRQEVTNASAFPFADASSCTHADKDKHENSAVTVDDKDQWLEQEAVELLHTGSTTTIAKYGTQSLQLGTVSNSAKIDDPVAERLTPIISSSSVVQSPDVEIKGRRDGSPSALGGSFSVNDNLSSQPMCQNDRSKRDRDVEPINARPRDYLDFPLESFELSPTGKVLSTEGASFDDDSELAVIGQAIPSAFTDASNDETTVAFVKPKGNHAETCETEGEPLGNLLSPALSRSSFSVSKGEESIDHSKSDLDEKHLFPSRESHISGLRTGVLDPDVVIENIRRKLAVNGETALRNQSLPLHLHVSLKASEASDNFAAFTSFSREALVDHDESSGDGEASVNEESQPLMSRTNIDDIDVVDLERRTEPDCDPTFDNLCASELLDSERSRLYAELREHMQTSLADPLNHESPAGAEEKKEENGFSDAESLCDSIQYQVKALTGGSFYERRKSASYGNRPLYDEEFTWGFLHGMMSAGVTLLQLQDESETRSGTRREQAVTMVIEPGSDTPRLEWTTIPAKTSTISRTSSIGLLDIASIRVRTDFESGAESATSFSLSTSEGNTYVFQAGSTYDRDMVVHGVRNLVAWLCYHLAAGDTSASSMMVADGDAPIASELPTALHRLRQMNNLAHAMLN